MPSTLAATSRRVPRCRRPACRRVPGSRSTSWRRSPSAHSGADWAWWPEQSSKLFGPCKGLGRFDSYTLPPPLLLATRWLRITLFSVERGGETGRNVARTDAAKRDTEGELPHLERV